MLSCDLQDCQLFHTRQGVYEALRGEGEYAPNTLKMETILDTYGDLQKAWVGTFGAFLAGQFDVFDPGDFLARGRDVLLFVRRSPARIPRTAHR